MVAMPEDHAWSSYRSTAGRSKAHSCLTTDWVLGQFSGKRTKAESEYRQFVRWGIGKQTIWTAVRGQALLGEDDFVDGLADHLRKQKDVPEIPRSQRYSTRPPLSKLLPESMLADQRRLKKKMMEAVEKYGYHQSQLARHLAVHRSTVSRWLRE